MKLPFDLNMQAYEHGKFKTVSIQPKVPSGTDREYYMNPGAFHQKIGRKQKVFSLNRFNDNNF